MLIHLSVDTSLELEWSSNLRLCWRWTWSCRENLWWANLKRPRSLRWYFACDSGSPRWLALASSPIVSTETPRRSCRKEDRQQTPRATSCRSWDRYRWPIKWIHRKTTNSENRRVSSTCPFSKQRNVTFEMMMFRSPSSHWKKTTREVKAVVGATIIPKTIDRPYICSSPIRSDEIAWAWCRNAVAKLILVRSTTTPPRSSPGKNCYRLLQKRGSFQNGCDMRVYVRGSRLEAKPGLFSGSLHWLPLLAARLSSDLHVNSWTYGQKSAKDTDPPI